MPGLLVIHLYLFPNVTYKFTPKWFLYLFLQGLQNAINRKKEESESLLTQTSICHSNFYILSLLQLLWKYVSIHRKFIFYLSPLDIWLCAASQNSEILFHLRKRTWEFQYNILWFFFFFFFENSIAILAIKEFNWYNTRLFASSIRI